MDLSFFVTFAASLPPENYSVSSPALLFVVGRLRPFLPYLPLQPPSSFSPTPPAGPRYVDSASDNTPLEPFSDAVFSSFSNLLAFPFLNPSVPFPRDPCLFS